MIPCGLYPASVTPFDVRGEVDAVSVARLMAHFDASGCTGVVVGGTNGEGPSLSAVERRDVCRVACQSAGRLLVIQGIATSSLTEAIWLASQAHKSGAAACLVMPPSYFRAVGHDAIGDWYEKLLDAQPCPIIAYNFPLMTGIALSPELIQRLASHERFIGLKDSSGEVANLAAYRDVLEDGHRLLVGDERLLVQALEAGWSGSISGVANAMPWWLAQVIAEWVRGDFESARAKFELVEPLIRSIRAAHQPATNKALLHSINVLETPDVRLPLRNAEAGEGVRMLGEIRDRIGMPNALNRES